MAMAEQDIETRDSPQQSTATASSSSWTGNVWIQDEWTEEDKTQARDRLLDNAAAAAAATASTASSHQHHHHQPHQHEQQHQEDEQQRHLQQKRAFREFRRNASTNWNVFYAQNKTNFFKDRHYLHKAFPREFGWLYEHHARSHKNGTTSDVDIDVDGGDDGTTIDATSGKVFCDGDNPHTGVKKSDVRIVEIGCGVGNAILPLVEQHSELMKRCNSSHVSTINTDSTTSCDNTNTDEAPTPTTRPSLSSPPQLHIHCLDFAPTAIELLQKDPRFRSAANDGRGTAHVYDLSTMHPSTIFIGNSDDDDGTTKSEEEDGATATTTKTTTTTTTTIERAIRQRDPKISTDAPSSSPQVLANSADVAILLFCLSAVGPHPSPSLDRAARHAIDMLKPGGTLVMRDYGRLDEAQMKLGKGDKELGTNFYRKGDGTGCYYFELDDLKELFVNQHPNDDKLELLELDYIQRVYRNRGDGTTRRRVWVQGRFRKPLSNAVSPRVDERRLAAVGGSGPDASSSDDHDDDDGLTRFLGTMVDRWDGYYKALSSPSTTTTTTTTSRYGTPSNVLQMFPNEFRSWQTPGKKGKRRRRHPTTDSGSRPSSEEAIIAPTELTVVDLGCGLGNDTLLDLVERQRVHRDEEETRRESPSSSSSPSSASRESSSKSPLLRVHFVDASREAIRKLRSDPRYRRATASDEESAEEPKQFATPAAITAQVCNLASAKLALAHLEQSADIALLLFTLSAIGPYRLRGRNGERSRSPGMANAVQNVASMLKPGGVVLFRDYARYDDDQLQLNSVVGAQLSGNFYVRGFDPTDHKESDSPTDGTGCFFFDLEEVRQLFTGAGLEVLQLEYVTRIYKKSGKNGRDCSKNGGAVERRRIWVHGKFRKPNN